MRHQIKKKTHPLSILSQSEKFMVVCYRDLDSGEKFNAVGEKLCINCDCYLYGNIVSNQKYGEQFQTAYYERSKMGKSQKGKELGIGISQRKDGLYTGRVTDPRTGKRIQKYFHKLQECRKWVADTQYEFAHGNVVYSENPTFKFCFFTGWNL